MMHKKTIIAIIDECADQTDIWDNERWGNTRKLLIKEFIKYGKKEDEILSKI